VRGFRDAIEEFRGLGVELLGVSADRKDAQARFARRLGVSFPLLCDPDGNVLRAYGVRGLMGYARRVTFLIDEHGTIRKIYPKVSPSAHAAEVLRDLKGLVG
jgi:peroxiredoxin Q/BCP